MPIFKTLILFLVFFILCVQATQAEAFDNKPQSKDFKDQTLNVDLQNIKKHDIIKTIITHIVKSSLEATGYFFSGKIAKNY